MTAIEQAANAWRCARDELERAIGDELPAASIAARQDARDDAEQRLRCAAKAQLGEDDLASLRAACAALLELEEHAAVEAELNASHGELAGASAEAQERLERVRSVLDRIGETPRADLVAELGELI